MRLLALDAATTTGWHCDGQGGVASFSRKHQISPHTIERHADIGSRFSSWLVEMIDMHQPCMLVVEAVPAGGIKGNTDLQRGIVMAAGIVAIRRELLLRSVYPKDWQGWAAKRGWTKAQKSDEADARWLHDYGIAEFMPHVLEAA